MEKAKEMLRVTQEESDAVSRLHSGPHLRTGDKSSFYEYFAVAGIRVERVEPGCVWCSFKAPSRLADRSGKLANGAIANLVDVDELEITSRVLGRNGGYSGTIVLIKNKATGELIAEGRHSLFGRHNSKM
ncbi:uncharacterized protein LOC109816292 isoform X2 [Cajanus cajan]|uniref:uncharacterized protein LOC109816292 isoform X2 n=1 Tax=Cajanus cajan TaxID=3821 RepID=UPI00098DCE3F|nr:uncharacterized protein LOC109816292 isoform X2 [Cajanus cajan]